MAQRAGAPRQQTWLAPSAARALRFAPADPRPGRYRTDFSVVTVAMDADRSGGWMVLLDDVLASYVDLADPTHLEFEYTRWMADIIDELPAGGLRVLHLGGAACTLPVYLQTRRPDSRQVVVEYDATLIELMRQQFGIRSSRRLKIVHDDALNALRAAPTGGYDIIIRDAFNGATTPEHLHGPLFAAEVRRVLADEGIYFANIGDRPGLALTRQLLADTASAFGLDQQRARDGRLAFICEPSVLRGRRLGNAVVAASARRLPLEGWFAATRRAALPARVTHGDRLTQYL
ncbi:spermidine synthase-like protein [Epidermidibacterium keratini]|uniref:Spermidine synthase-like protein n=1 Tax=Epidermidibacterium keratini TaxID=1891644 RepID=A0A7L4YRR9_9ACTN|nr:fused MFS/spermidine synthase [Epidermidibacterium keratini]QHC01941.1 spermidine synthase-like protein [Epidermidibacterium keratini]